MQQAKCNGILAHHFHGLVSEYLKHHDKKELACPLGIIPSTVKRWALGLATPMPGMQRMVIAWINAARKVEGW